MPLSNPTLDPDAVSRVESVTQGQTRRSVHLPGVTVTETIHPAEARFGRHTHQFAALTVPLSGQFTETIGAREHLCRPGAVLLKGPGVVHCNEYGINGSHALIIEILCPESFPGETDLTSVEARLVHGLPWALAFRLHRGLDGGPSRLEFEELLGEVLAPSSDDRRVVAGRSAPAWLRRVRERLEVEWRDPPTLSALAEMADVHPVYLARVFRRVYRCSVGEWVRRTRLDAAVAGLLEESLPLARLAVRLGFYDQSHFTRHFRDASGITPGAFRRWARRLGHGEVRPDEVRGSDRTIRHGAASSDS